MGSRYSQHEFRGPLERLLGVSSEWESVPCGLLCQLSVKNRFQDVKIKVCCALVGGDECFPKKGLAHSFYWHSFLDDKSGQDDGFRGGLGCWDCVSYGRVTSWLKCCQGMLPGIYVSWMSVGFVTQPGSVSLMRPMAGKERYAWLRPPRARMFVECGQGKYSRGSGHRKVHSHDLALGHTRGCGPVVGLR
eukprot:s412_g3.t1